MTRLVTYATALAEAFEISMARDKAVYIIGLGVPDPSGFFGTTKGLQEKFGRHRAMDMPTAENGMTGVVIGSALTGMRPIIAHHRMEFSLLAVEQIINQAANWYYMFGGRSCLPLVVRMFIGRGWGQGPQHSQSLQAMFAHIPGLKVVMPATAYDAKGLMISAIEDNNPVIFIEHRWLHSTVSEVPAGYFKVPIGTGVVRREGKDITIVSHSYMVTEVLAASEILNRLGICVEVIDLRSVRPIDTDIVICSIKKTRRILVVEQAWRSVGVAAEIIAIAAESLGGWLKANPRRLTLPDAPAPCSPSLARFYYPQTIDIVNSVLAMFEIALVTEEQIGINTNVPYDVPRSDFRGPF